MSASRHARSLVVALLAGCVSGGLRGDAKYAIYAANAGAPVNSFHYNGSINGWTSLGDAAIAVWTRPSEAWLLDLSGPCQNLPYATTIGVTSTTNRVSARFDKVLVGHRGPGVQIPCHIQQIRALDVKAVREAERTARDALGEPDQASATGT
ncbi:MULTISPECIES: DUF6491 family protein [Luteimonas]|uniref:DUF6491 family protein n=1 Tax=Luteimonas TaxID=83614 RepID=UPI00117D5CA0|nr:MULTISPECIES: DUF6491 family protein [Luteimonas]